MKKLVSESIREFRERKSLNEGIFDRVGRFIKSTLQKIGKLFWFINQETETPDPVIAPVNIGIMVKNRMINPAISYLPVKAI